MANYHNLLSKCDRALAAYLLSKGAGTSDDVLPAKNSAERPLPATVCFSSKGAEAAPYSGTYLIESSIMVRTGGAVELNAGASDARRASEERVAKTFDAFHTNLDSSGDKLADDITAAARALAIANPTDHGDLADFTVQNVMIKGVDAGFEDGTVVWIDTLDLQLVACPSDVSDA